MCTLIPFSFLLKKNHLPILESYEICGSYSHAHSHEILRVISMSAAPMNFSQPLRSSECIPGGTPDAMGTPCTAARLSCGPAFTVMPDLVHLRRTSSGQVVAHHLSSPFNPEALVYQSYYYDPFMATLLSGFLFPWLVYSQGLGFPRWLSGKESACQAADVGLISGLERSPGEGNGNPLQYFCLENPMGRGAWWAIVHGVAQNQT